jgi:GT2 family glycosyltransferase
MSARVLVSIVTHNSEQYLKTCLDSLKAQTCRDFGISIWDNASTDGTENILTEYRNILSAIHFSKNNVGFCTAHNRLIVPASAEYHLLLNPDVVLEARFLENIIQEMDRDPRAGSATGKLWRWQTEPLNLEDFLRQQQFYPKILDTTGIYFTPTQRHFDRGSGETDVGQFDCCEYVFGASGAAAFYRRTMLQDILDKSGYLDENFFAYREDADLAWRAQWMGWRCLYIPEATGYHVRRVLPERRSSLPGAINMHSFKNRFLMRIKNMDFVTYACFFIPIALRDIAILAYVLIREHSSLPGIPLLIRAFPQTWAMRKSLQRRRRASAREIRSWFSYRPIAKPIQD